MQRLAIHLDGARVKIDRELAGADDGFGMTFGTAHNCLDASDELTLVEGLGEVIVGTVTEAFDFLVGAGEAGENQDRGGDARGAEAAQHFIPVNIGQHQVKYDDVVIIKLAYFRPFLAELSGIADDTFRSEG